MSLLAQRQTTVRLRDGTTRDLLPGEQLPPGARVIRVKNPLLMQDAAGAPVSDAEISEARDAADAAWNKMRDDIGNAWRGPTTVADTGPKPQTVDEAHEAYKQHLSNAWRGN